MVLHQAQQLGPVLHCSMQEGSSGRIQQRKWLRQPQPQHGWWTEQSSASPSRHRQIWQQLSFHPSGREMLGHHHLDAGSTRAIVVDPHPLRGSHHYHDVLRLSSRQIHSQVPSQHLEALKILDQAPGKVEIHSHVSTVVVGHGHPVGLHLQPPLPLDVS